MNDEFLTEIHKVPRAEFAGTLYARISQSSQSRFPWAMTQKLTFRNSVIVFALLFLVAACVYAVVDRGWRKVGDIWINVEKTHKAMLWSVPMTSEGLEIQPQDDPGCISLAEARETLRFDLYAPTRAPEGFTFDGRACNVDRMSNLVLLYWKGADEQSFIQLMAQNLKSYDWSTQDHKIGPAVIWGPVAPGSYEEVKVHGQPAVLIHGDWDYVEKDFKPSEQAVQTIDSEWNSKLAIQLYWVDGEVMYHLYTRSHVSPEDLIKMAESAR